MNATNPVSRLNTALRGRYHIERQLGEGGMATVYLAADVRHDRHVALKVLKPELAAVVGAERFLAEIKTTANLQHPHILPLFDSGEADSFLFYVMPFVEGETLEARLGREHQLPIEDAVRIASDIAEGLEYAHTQGVLHRDIKPANILLQAGRPVISDFGIALAVGAAGGGRLTETGLSVGTPHYMSPEQATGDQNLGPTTDIYALGCVLYEMLVGEPPFTGTTAQAILGRIIAGAPASTSAQRTSVPPHVDAAVAKSLEKLPADRFRSAREFARALSDPAFRHGAPPLQAPTDSGRPWKRAALAGWGVAALSIIGAIALLATRPGSAPVSRFPMVLPADQPLFYSGPSDPPRFDLLPDGAGLVYTLGPDAVLGLGLRNFSELRGRSLPGTEFGMTPAVSPDGSRVAFWAAARAGLAVASLAGGPSVTAVESGVRPGVAWGSDEWIYYVAEPGFLLRRVRADGSDLEDVVELDPSIAPGGFAFVNLLPGERGVLVTAFPEVSSQIDEFAVHVVDLGTGRSTGSVGGLYGVYADSGHLLYVTSSGVLTGTGLDPSSLRVSSNSVALAEGVDVRGPGFTDLSISRNGTLAYATPSLDTPEKAVFVSPSGNVEGVDPTWDQLLEFEGMALSPTGDRLVLAVQSIGRVDLWVKGLGGGSWSRFVPGGTGTRAPAWTPDGRSISFVTTSEPSIVKMKPADGSSAERVLIDVGRPVREMRWSRDGEWLVFGVDGPPSDDIFAWRAGGNEPPAPLVAGPFDEFEPALSADGRFLAYVSVESGMAEVIVVPFPEVEQGRNQVSRGGFEPIWDLSEPRLYFRNAAQTEIRVADFSAGLRPAVARLHFTMPPVNDYEHNPRERLIEMAPDGRFVFIERSGGFGTSGHPVIVQNFFQELRERVDGGR
jgi:serine/threonine-protein kinase